MLRTVELPIWALVLLCLFAAVTFASHFLFPSVRWFFRRRAEKVVAQLNERLSKPIEPFKLAGRVDTINRLTHDPEVAQAIIDYAASTGVPEQVAFETARRYAREIVPSFSALLYFKVATRLARWLSRSLYRVRVTGESEAMDGIPADATVIFVLNHRSNMDYVLVTWLAARRTALAYAVGEWARRWPLRPLIRAMGGYFVRRRNLNGLYRKVLARYVQIATNEGVTQAIFPEGRLSRDGALHAPKLGILSYIVANHDPEAARDVVFVPVAINYERVLEDHVLLAARSQGAKAFRLRWWMVARYLEQHIRLRLTGRFSRFGYAAVAFGRPLSLHGFLAISRADATEDLATELLARISDCLPVLPLALVCEALAQGQTDLSAISDHLEKRATALRAAGYPVHQIARDPQNSALIALRMLQSRNMLDLESSQAAPKPEGGKLFAFYAKTLPVIATQETESFAKEKLEV
ncbi:MAG: 1-acyl-sn-glycerol-3-phosphate acyltransferase [Pseudomonadota bacterium]